MKVLVTGASGFLGGALFERLLAHGERDIRCVLRSRSAGERLTRVAEGHTGAKVEFLIGSLASKEVASAALADVDVVYHLAANMRGAAAEQFFGTVVTTKNLLDAVARKVRPTKFILVSSFSVYGVADLPRGHLIDENTPLETAPAKRDAYAQAKLRQESLVREYQAKCGFPLVVLRPGVIFGPRGGAFSARVGLNLPGLFLFLGANNPLPLTYVDNCADAIVLASRSTLAVNETFNVHDDDLPTCRSYFARYRREVDRIRFLPIPYSVLRPMAGCVEWYHHFSRGQLPAILTPYRCATTWKAHRFDNTKLKSIGVRPLVPMEEALHRTFKHLREEAS